MSVVFDRPGSAALVLKGPRNYADAEISPENFLFLPEVLLYAGWDHSGEHPHLCVYEVF